MELKRGHKSGEAPIPGDFIFHINMKPKQWRVFPISVINIVLSPAHQNNSVIIQTM